MVRIVKLHERKLRLVKRKVPMHQWKYRKKYGITRKTFYKVMNPAGETVWSGLKKEIRVWAKRSKIPSKTFRGGKI